MENESIESRVQDIEKRLNGMMLTDRKFWKRTVAIFGYQCFGMLVIYAGMVAFAMVMAFAIGFVGAVAGN